MTCNCKDRESFRVFVRNGFSVVELVCSIAIIMAVVGLILPSIQKVREASRNTVCLGNLQRIGLAAINYESGMQKLPPGNLGFDDVVIGEETITTEWQENSASKFYWKNAQHTSSLALLLPFVEQKSLYDSFPPELSSRRLYGDYPNVPHSWIGEWSNVESGMQVSISEFFCPSDDLSNGIKSVAIIGSQPVYILGKGNIGTEGYLAMSIENNEFHSTNYIGCAGAYSGGRIPDKTLGAYRGALGCRDQMKLADIRDGTTNTILFGEALGSINETERLASFVWMFGSIGRGRGGLPWGKLSHPPAPDRLLFGDWKDSHIAAFGSKHPSTTNVAFVGGASKTVTRAIDLKVWYGLCGIRDGLSFTSDDL